MPDCVNSILCFYSDINSDLDLLAQNPEEDCDDKNKIVATRTLTVKCISLARSHTDIRKWLYKMTEE